MQCLKNALAYFAMAASYRHKLFMKLTPDTSCTFSVKLHISTDTGDGNLTKTLKTFTEIAKLSDLMPLCKCSFKRINSKIALQNRTCK
jgi:hypothetical protein